MLLVGCSNNSIRLVEFIPESVISTVCHMMLMVSPLIVLIASSVLTIPQVCATLHDEAHGDDLEEHLRPKDNQKYMLCTVQNLR